MEIVCAVAVDLQACRRSRACSEGRVTAEHCNTRAVLGTTKGNHMLAYMGGDKLAIMRAAAGQDVLD